MKKLPLRRDLLPWRGQFVSVAGEIVSSVVEASRDPRKIDHVWIDLRAGESGVIRVSLNTCSIKNRDAGFDPRVRLSIVAGSWTVLPVAEMRSSEPLDYRTIEATNDLQ